MKVHAEPFEDAGEKNEQGYYDYYYSGTVFTFQDGEAGLIARQYNDKRQEAHFLAWLRDRNRILFSEIPCQDRLFREAVSYLIDKIQVCRIKILLSNGYVPVDLAKLEMAIPNELP
jgi:hypothetical protein